MYLILTDKCNLGCKYCFADSSFPYNYKTGSMTWETAHHAFEFFKHNVDRSYIPDIWFYGGEPFLESELLFNLANYISINEPSFSMTVISNGTLITPEIAQQIKAYPNINITVSVDGAKEIHDANRVYKNGNGSFEAVERGIACPRQAGVPFGISCTIGTTNVEYTFETIQWLHEHFGTTNIGTNFLVDTPRQFVTEDYIHRANQGLIKFFKNYREGSVTENRFLRKIDTFVSGKPRWQDCSACGGQIVISPDGQIGICHEGLGERHTFVGSLWDKNFDFYNNPTVNEWAMHSPINQEECLSCPALAVCGGGCPYGAMLKYGSIWNIDRRFCIHSKEALEWLIWDLYDKVLERLS